MTEITKLNRRFGIANQLTFELGEGGHIILHIKNKLTHLSLSLQGAQLLSWTPSCLPRHTSDDVLWVSEEAIFSSGRPIRGGIPICWPWFGDHLTENTFPAHGFARAQNWEMVATEILFDGRISFALRLFQDAVNKEYRIDGAEPELQVTVGESLEMSLITRNSSEKNITVGGAFHTYFSVSEIQNVSIHGLEGQVFIDTLDNWQRKKEDKPIKINGEIDRIYFDEPNTLSIKDKGLDRRIKISKQGSHSTVVWNPWKDKSKRLGDMGEDGYKKMICVETTNAATDMITIEPEGEHRLSVCYEVEAL